MAKKKTSKLAKPPSDIHIEEWVRNFLPVPLPPKGRRDPRTPLRDLDGELYFGQGHCMIGTHDTRRIRKVKPKHLWTVLGPFGGDDKLVIVAGLHLVDRYGYIETARPWGDPRQATKPFDPYNLPY